MTTTTPRRAKARRGFTNADNARDATTFAPDAAPDSTAEFAPTTTDDGPDGGLHDALANAPGGRWRRGWGAIGRQLRRVRPTSWALLLVALIAINYFTFQTFRIPQQQDYQPNWYGAQWIATADQPGNVMYVRKDIAVDSIPDGAFLTVQGSQTIDLYINGSLLGSTTKVFNSGATNRAFIYDLTPLLVVGGNVIAMRVENRDTNVAAVRAVIGLIYGDQRETFPSNATWLSTGDALRVFPPYLPAVTPDNVNNLNIVDAWRTTAFDDTPWLQSVPYTGATPPAGVLNVDPATYENAFPQTWLSSGTGSDGYFYTQLTAPSLHSAWLRLASDGTASVYVNGQLLIQQNEQITTLDVYTGANNSQVNLYGVTIGVYDITPYLHVGANTLAVHVVMSHYDFVTSKPFARPTSLGLDLLGITPNGSRFDQSADGTWRVATNVNSDWVTGAGTQSWRPGVVVDEVFLVNRPAYKVLATTLERPHTYDVAPILLVTTALFLLACEVTLAAELWRRRRLTTLAQAIDRLALGFVPLIGLMALLLILSEEPLIPNPFPYTVFWLWVAIGVAALSQLLIILTPRIRATERHFDDRARLRRIDRQWRSEAIAAALAQTPDDDDTPTFPDPDTDAADADNANDPPTGAIAVVRRRAVAVGAYLGRQPLAAILGWALALAGTVVGAVIGFTGLTYEPYWPDELDSLEVARGILQDGIPHLASGFIYPKAELYHYELAAVIALFGENPVATRSLAVLAFLATLPLTYFVAYKLFDRRVGLMTMGLLLFSPFELWWAQQTRMYQQAQLFVLLVFYFFYKATQPGARRRYIYLSMGAVVLMYLSHEEGFIVLPAIFIYFLLTQRLNWIRNRDWWIAGLGAIGVIGVQLIIVKLTAQPILGQDSSQRPDIGFSPQNVDYYLRLLFNTASLSSPIFGRYQLTYVSVIAFAVCGVAIIARSPALRYAALFFMASFLTLTLLLTLRADRYFYPLYPEMLMLASVGVIWGLDRVTAVARRRISPMTARVFVGVCAACLIVAVFASQIPAVSVANLTISRTLGIPFGRQIPDYAQAGAYVQAHWETGDALVVLTPAVDSQYYSQEQPYTLYLGQALYIHEKGSHILDNYTGNLTLINEHDLVSVLAKYHRVWMIRTTGYYSTPAQQFQVNSFFFEVYETDGITVYLDTP